MGNPVKRKMPQAVGGLLKKELQKRGLWRAMREQSVMDVWDSVVGPIIAERCRPVEIRDGVLELIPASPAWTHELTYQKDDIIRRLNRELGRGVVKDFKFVTRAKSR